MSDPPLPDDFDPTQLVDDPMQHPSQSKDKHQERAETLEDVQEDESAMHVPFLPDSLKKKLFAGSCCTGVAVLYFVSAWDNGFIPELESQFAMAEDQRAIELKYEQKDKTVNRLIVLQIAQAIRELSAINCTAPSNAISQQLDSLRLEYVAMTSSHYPHIECKRS